MIQLLVKEVFYSLQGEGGRAGEASIFVRLSGCNKQCWFCDTDWRGGVHKTLSELLIIVQQYAPCRWIVWTGGEPTLQLDEHIVLYFKSHGFKQAIETNGSNPVPKGIDYISVSPKVGTDILNQNFRSVDEIRYPVGKVREEIVLPPRTELLPPAKLYYVSPIFLGERYKRLDLSEPNLDMAIKYVRKNPIWRLSVQQHKSWNIL